MRPCKRCAKCGCLVHLDRLAIHPCEYLRRNILVASAEGAKAEARYILNRLNAMKNPPRWMIDSAQAILDRVEKLPADLAKYRNQERSTDS